MTTRDVSSLEVRPATDGTGLSPVPTHDPREPGPKDFTAVMDHALNRKPVPQRAAKPAGRSRNEDPKPGHPVRTKVQPIARKKSAIPAGVAKGEEPKCEGKVERADGPAADIAIPPSNLSLRTDAPSDLLLRTEVEPGEDLLASIVPDNIIAFPVPSNIIPFPLDEARKAKGPEAGRGAGVQASTEAGEKPNGGEITPSRLDALADNDSNSNEGSDVTAPGLQPLAEPELAENVHAVDFAKESVAQSALDDPSVATVIPVTFRPDNGTTNGEFQMAKEAPSDTRKLSSTIPPERETQLPGDVPRSEESALPAAFTAPSVVRTPSRLNSTKQAGSADRRAAQGAAVNSAEASGTSTARQDHRMESLRNAEQDGTFGGRPADGPSSGATARPSQDAFEDIPGRSATDWQASRTAGQQVSRPADQRASSAPTDTARSVERITGLVSREAALVKQHSSDSMTVLLRPDAETELLVHFTQRDGQIEASIRCERGDSQHLGALWPQLQESLAQQKVRLAPLQESSFSQPDFNSSSGADRNGSGPGSDRQPPNRQSLDEWPAPASSASSTAHVRGGGGSRHRRISTSRPGWETWA